MSGGLQVLRDILRHTVLVLSVLAVGLILIVAAVVALVVWEFTSGAPSAHNMQQAIEHGIPPGASLDEITAWLNTEGKKRGIEHGGDRTSKAFDYSRLLDLGVPPDTRVYHAILRGNPGLNIYFLLDEGIRFQRVIVQQYFVLP